MLNYLKDNPRRLALKRMFPDLFHTMRRIPIDNGYLEGIGNRFLLDAHQFHQIQVSRRISLDSPEYAYAAALLQKAIAQQSVIVSPCISEGERALAHLAFDSNARLIVLRNNCFPPLYKPSGKYFDACAQGRLLLLAPPGFGYAPGHRTITREEACVLNCLAQRICGPDATFINYHGMVPQHLEALVAKAICQ